ncbi:MAG TPA: hypothetical protein VN924_12390 [Bryobacteraceae bacterium]|nr:hypothetical protein [Bryobacteraceae bacterium]
MNLSDLRKVTVRKHLRIRFSLSNGMECVVNEHGIAQVPALRAVPAFNLEEELAGAQAFVVEPAEAGDKDKVKSKPRSYTRVEMSALATAGAGAQAAHDEHEE